MSDVAIRVEGLGKSYLIGHEAQRERYTALRDVMASSARRLAGSVRDRLAMRPVASGQTTEEFWALKDVNFEIRHGEVVGIIGRNGAGKSTLLKILSRITEPSEGRVTIDGRVASLLEVGTGFHPELTGRENIYLNGAILGMTRAEIRRKFDEIVDFAEVERFLDTPVKRYSSGMYVRLAFAVAAHLEPEILIVDEVLAVGDGEFQRKCLGKMHDVAHAGRAVLMVSHNLAAVRRLCQTSILLNQGRMVETGKVDDVLSSYSELTSSDQAARWTYDPSVENDYFVPREIAWDGTSRVTVTGRVGDLRSNLTLGLRLLNDSGDVVLVTTHRDHPDSPTLKEASEAALHIELPIDVMKSGIYRAEFIVFLHNERFIVGPEGAPAVSIEFERRGADGEMASSRREGAISPDLAWRHV